MLGLVTRVVEAQISLSLDVMRKSAEFAGRIAGWALTEATRQFTPERPVTPPPVETRRPPATARPSKARSGSAARKADDAREATPAEPSDAHATASTAEVDGSTPEVDGAAERGPSEPVGSAPEPASPGPEHVSEKAASAEPEHVSEEPTVVYVSKDPSEDVSGGEDGDTVELEPEVGTSGRARTPHSALNNPVTEPDVTEWPDPYDKREDPRDPGEGMAFGGDADHVPSGAISTSEPHPSQDPEAEPWEGPKRDKVDQ